MCIVSKKQDTIPELIEIIRSGLKAYSIIKM